MTDAVAFNILRPFRTTVGWPARLVGVLQRRSNPYVVAVWNPEWKSEELHVYPASGKHSSTLDPHPLDLVEIPDEEYWKWAAPAKGTPETPVHAFVTREQSVPPGTPVSALDFNLITPLVRGWHATSEGYDNRDEPSPLRGGFKLYNERTGDVFRVRFTPMDQRELEARDGK
jgi:hypothetical protein